eukprot:SAG22_NODE_15527_length_345_cov_1.558704_1_plen_72_part_01
MHTHAATACFFVLDARRSVELRIPPKDAVEDVRGRRRLVAGEGGGGGRARPVRFLFFFSCGRRSQTFWFFSR